MPARVYTYRDAGLHIPQLRWQNRAGVAASQLGFRCPVGIGSLGGVFSAAASVHSSYFGVAGAPLPPSLAGGVAWQRVFGHPHRASLSGSGSSGQAGQDSFGSLVRLEIWIRLVELAAMFADVFVVVEGRTKRYEAQMPRSPVPTACDAVSSPPSP